MLNRQEYRVHLYNSITVQFLFSKDQVMPNFISCKTNIPKVPVHYIVPVHGVDETVDGVLIHFMTLTAVNYHLDYLFTSVKNLCWYHQLCCCKSQRENNKTPEIMFTDSSVFFCGYSQPHGINSTAQKLCYVVESL